LTSIRAHPIRGGVRLGDVDHAELDRWVDVLVERVGLDRFQSIARDHADTGFGRHKRHYLDLRQMLGKDVYDLLLLGLTASRPLAILDIGTGPASFAYVGRQFGHRVVATEREDDESLLWSWWTASAEEKRERRGSMDRPVLEQWLRSRPSLYGDLAKLFGVERVFWTVAQGPAPDLGMFDLVAARDLYFNHVAKRETRVWTPAEWRVFAANLLPLMVPEGWLFLSWPDTPDAGMNDIAIEWRVAGASIRQRELLASRRDVIAFASGHAAERGT